jgi:transcriptional regulator with XRE-family HTH domain
MYSPEKEKCNKKTIQDEAIILRKMRELKGLSRKQAGIIFNLTNKTIEKLENGRGKIDEQRLVAFASGYGFTLEDLMKIKSGQYDTDLSQKNRLKKEKDPKRRDRRFCKPNITKECKALRQLREKRGISQYKLSLACGFAKQRIGFYECGRRNLNKELIETIIKKMGYSMDEFYEQMEADEMPYEIINECNQIMKKLEIKTLKAVRSFLQGFA